MRGKSFVGLFMLLALGCQSGPQHKNEGERGVAGQSVPQWNEYGGVRTASRMGEKFSALDQIHTGNVKKLKKLWVYNTNEKAIPGPKSLEVTPVYHQGKLFGCSIFNKVFALDGETGRELWSFNPDVRKSEKVWAYKCRGVAIWSEPRPTGKMCDTRVISNTIDGRVLALDADSGKPCPDFMDRVDGSPIPGAAAGEVAAWVNVMVPNQPEDKVALISKQKAHPFRDEFYMTSAPLIFEDLIIVGGGIADNGRVDATSGAVQAFDVRTGELNVGPSTRQQDAGRSVDSWDTERLGSNGGGYISGAGFSSYGSRRARLLRCKSRRERSLCKFHCCTASGSGRSAFETA